MKAELVRAALATRGRYPARSAVTGGTVVTSIRLPAELAEAAKQMAAERGVGLAQYLRDCVYDSIAGAANCTAQEEAEAPQTQPPPHPYIVSLTTSKQQEGDNLSDE